MKEQRTALLEKTELLNKTELFVLDMDGTFIWVTGFWMERLTF